MTEQEFADRENWLGSFYEMGIEYAPGTSGQQLLAAIEAPWQHPLLEGPVIGPYSDHASALTPTTIPPVLENMSRLYGMVHLPRRRTIGCISLVMGSGTDSIEEISARDTCWVMLAIPMGWLSRLSASCQPAQTNRSIQDFPHGITVVPLGQLKGRDVALEAVPHGSGRQVSADVQAHVDVAADRVGVGAALMGLGDQILGRRTVGDGGKVDA